MKVNQRLFMIFGVTVALWLGFFCILFFVDPDKAGTVGKVGFVTTGLGALAGSIVLAWHWYNERKDNKLIDDVT